MSEVLTQPAETPAAKVEVLTPPAASVSPSPAPTAAVPVTADGATPPNPNATPPAESQPGAPAGLTVENLTTREELDEFIGAIQEGRMTFGDEPGATPPAPAAAPATTETAAATPPGPSEVPSTATPPAADPAPTELDDVLPPPGQLPKALKMHTKGDPLRFETMRIMKEWDDAGKQGTFGEAEKLAMQVLKLEPATDAVPPAGEAAPAETAKPEVTIEMPKTVADTTRRIKELNVEEARLAAAFRFEEAADIKNQIADLTEHRESLRFIERDTKEHEASYSDHWTKAATAEQLRYKDHGGTDGDSALSIVAATIQAQWINSSDPRLNDPATAPGLIYAAAAQKLGLAAPAAPAAATPPAASTSPPTSEVSTVKPAVRQMSPAQALLASGTAAGAPPQRSELDLSRFTNAHDLDSAIANGLIVPVEGR